jgi:ubiquinone/menaquinone biosynthesis C-methylase UbiE
VNVDVGTGTGSQGIAIKRRAPGTRVIGLDPDPQVLALAREKAKTAGVDIEWVEGLGDQAAQILDHGVATKVVSSLVLHQSNLDMKAAILRTMAQVLQAGGQLTSADYGLQRTPLMKLLFRQVQALDGWERTGLNAEGILPRLIAEGDSLLSKKFV